MADVDYRWFKVRAVFSHDFNRKITRVFDKGFRLIILHATNLSLCLVSDAVFDEKNGLRQE